MVNGGLIEKFKAVNRFLVDNNFSFEHFFPIENVQDNIFTSGV